MSSVVATIVSEPVCTSITWRGLPCKVTPIGGTTQCRFHTVRKVDLESLTKEDSVKVEESQKEDSVKVEETPKKESDTKPLTKPSTESSQWCIDYCNAANRSFGSFISISKIDSELSRCSKWDHQGFLLTFQENTVKHLSWDWGKPFLDLNDSDNIKVFPFDSDKLWVSLDSQCPIPIEYITLNIFPKSTVDYILSMGETNETKIKCVPIFVTINLSHNFVMDFSDRKAFTSLNNDKSKKGIEMYNANVVNEKFLTYRNLVHYAFANVSNNVVLYNNKRNIFFIDTTDINTSLHGFFMLQRVEDYIKQE